MPMRYRASMIDVDEFLERFRPVRPEVRERSLGRCASVLGLVPVGALTLLLSLALSACRSYGVSTDVGGRPPDTALPTDGEAAPVSEDEAPPIEPVVKDEAPPIEP
jgi:hypothetical protein